MMNPKAHARIIAALSLFCLIRLHAQAIATADLTLAPDAYMDMGLPAIDRPWAPQDYRSAMNVLLGLDENEIPRSNSRSAAVFDRIADPENLGLLLNGSLPLYQRLLASLEIMESANAILKIYYAAQTTSPALSDDTMSIFGFVLQATSAQLRLIDEFVATLDSSDSAYETRMEGLERMKGGLAQIVQGVLMSLGEDHVYGEGARVGLAGIVADTYPTMRPMLPRLARVEFDRRLKEMADDSAEPAIAAELRGLIHRIESGPR